MIEFIVGVLIGGTAVYFYFRNKQTTPSIDGRGGAIGINDNEPNTNVEVN